MGYIPGKSHVEAQEWGRGWIALWAGFGHTRLRHVSGPDKRAKQFPCKAEALEAGIAALRAHEPDIKTTAKVEEHDPIGDKLAAEIGSFRERREIDNRTLRRTVFRGLGKGSVAVETVKRRGA
ncbi:hypothetical protein [Aureimonas psammosilenae]|uniref:hypothetical protein n=1 Tax=Aureimonas psammosilenae TaxID=2495496 RepID=UPI001260990E|nr:hypothetical protein [Aureimonas psammosilenae]